MKKNIFVSGSNGMMSSYFCEYMLNHYGDKYNVHGADDFSGSYRDNEMHHDLKFTELDLRDKEKTKNYFHNNFYEPGLDIAILYAASAQEIRSYFSPIANASVNDDCAKNCIVNALSCGCKYIVYISSMSRYGKGQPPFHETDIPRPQDPYACSKVYIENFLKALQHVHDFTYTIWIPHNAFSPRQYVDPYRNFLAIWMNLILMNKDCYIYGDGLQERAISWVDDYNPIICKSLFNPKTYNETINIGGDVFLSINDWYKMVQVATGWDRPAIHIEARPGEVRNAYCCHDKAKLLTGFENKINPFHALNEMWAYFKNKGPREFKYLDDFELDSPRIPKTWREKIF